jgi:hypothetical protein
MTERRSPIPLYPPGINTAIEKGIVQDLMNVRQISTKDHHHCCNSEFVAGGRCEFEASNDEK